MWKFHFMCPTKCVFVNVYETLMLNVSFGTCITFSYILAGTIASSFFFSSNWEPVPIVLNNPLHQWFGAVIFKLCSLDLPHNHLEIWFEVEFPDPHPTYYVRSSPWINIINGHPGVPKFPWSPEHLHPILLSVCHNLVHSGNCLLNVCLGKLNEFVFHRLMRRYTCQVKKTIHCSPNPAMKSLILGVFCLIIRCVFILFPKMRLGE